MQFFFQLFWQWHYNTSYRYIAAYALLATYLATFLGLQPLYRVLIHVTSCNLKLQLAMVLKQSMQSLQKVEPISTLCIRFKPKKSSETSCKEGMLHATTYLQLVSQRYCNIATELQRKSRHVILAVEFGSTFCNDCRDF